MIYEKNKKHGEPWQSGKKGSLCPVWEPNLGQSLLDDSTLSSQSGHRFATRNGWAFAALEHASGRWHGYPVAWLEVDEIIRRQWIEEGKVRRRQVQKRWSLTEIDHWEEGDP